jgi:hypothetical protein
MPAILALLWFTLSAVVLFHLQVQLYRGRTRCYFDRGKRGDLDARKTWLEYSSFNVLSLKHT